MRWDGPSASFSFEKYSTTSLNVWLIVVSKGVEVKSQRRYVARRQKDFKSQLSKRVTRLAQVGEDVMIEIFDVNQQNFVRIEIIPPRFSVSARLHVRDRYLQWILDYHCTDATSISATVFSAPISTTDIETGMGRCPSSQLFFVDNGKTMAALPAFSVFISRFEPVLCVFLRLYSCLSLLEMKVVMGRREGRHANEDSLDVSFLLPLHHPFLIIAIDTQRIAV